ncbi:MAG: cysteine--tRNA ligase [Thaumarchaeota archaeon]|jgi:cysteinyl-tRNA synthetase|nr:cysteine--tRNA ligase [Nitrososphaerota archaeon]MBT5843067.1 cysteine--tRNA ligase [Nitrososphaerota archaeon]
MKLQDTLKNSEQELEESKKLKIYLCGVTVYDESHIGHARTIIVFDVLRKYLESKGREIEFIQNFTDIDDKIINRANTENTTAEKISTRYIENYFKDFDGLNVKRATNYPKATEHIDDIIKFIEKLIEKNIAYVSKNGVYFAVTKFPEYGKLSKKKIDELQSGARIQVDEAKNNPLDFAVWKFSDIKPVWESPWGEGRPGWHIECSAMSVKYLGENFDIHGGGRDLIFPHHENEIAQSEACTESPFAKIWMHVGMVTIEGEKMSKSLGNTKSIKYVLENWGPNVIRLFCLSGHYSKVIDYSESLLAENLVKWRQAEMCYYEMTFAKKVAEKDLEKLYYVQIQTNKCIDRFNKALESNLNTHEAKTAFFDFVDEINGLAARDKLDNHIVDDYAYKQFGYMMNVLGLQPTIVDGIEHQQIEEMISKREMLRDEKKWEHADQIREVLRDIHNVEIIDHDSRTIWVKKENIKAEKQKD